MLKKRVFGMMVVLAALALVFALVGCGGGDGGSAGGDGTVTYTGGTGSKAYRLEITENTARYVAQTGDNFKLIEVISTKTMLGIIEISGGGTTITLIPNNGSDPITVTVSGSGIVSINGSNLLWDDGSTFIAPGDLDSGSNPGSLSGTYTNSDNNFRYTFTGSNYTTEEYYGSWENHNQGTYSLTQSEITLNRTHYWSGGWVESPDSDTFTISITSNSFTIHGTTYTK